MVRPVEDSKGQAWYGHATFELTEVISTAAGSIAVATRKVIHEQRATHVQDDVWQFEWLDAGTSSVYDASGKLLLRAAGVLRATQQIDTLGDSARRAGTDGRTIDDAFCEAVLPHLT